ncbi:nudC domain-containing protein 2-like [Trichechus inunguis]
MQRPWRRCSLKFKCRQALAARISIAACRAGMWRWPWVATRSSGKLLDSTIADEGTWTLEDRKMVRIVLTKTKRDVANCWTSLIESEYAADPWVQDQMQRKLTLERFHKENPGFDFSGAEISGNYTKGGPDFSNLEK